MRVAAAVLVTLMLVSCAGRQELVSAPAAAPDEPRFELPRFVPASPAFRVVLKGRATNEVITRVQRVGGVVVAAPVSVGRVPVTFANARHVLRVVAVEPLAFRSVAPGSTRAADYVWTSLLGGRAVLTSDAAKALGFGSSGSVLVRTSAVDVGAFADNGTPNIGDVMIPDRLARVSGLSAPDEIVIGTRTRADLDRVGKALKDKLGKKLRSIRRLQPQSPAPTETPDPVGTAEGDLIGSMNFRILKDGFIDPDPAWVHANIAHGTVPILGTVTCHRLMFPQLVAALSEIESEGLGQKINVRQYGGCYVPRFIDRDPRRALSMHAFGLALDLNVSRNLLGTRGDMDQRVIAIFEKWGFEWGGRWSPRPDPMHFELARLINV